MEATTMKRKVLERGIRKRGDKYQVRVTGQPAQTTATYEAAKEIRRVLLDTRAKEAVGIVVAAPSTLGEELDRYVASKSRRVKLRTQEFLHRTAKGWDGYRHHPVSRLTRAMVEDRIHDRERAHPQSAKNELALLKAVLRQAEGRDQRIDRRILAIPPVKHTPRTGEALTAEQADLIASFMDDHVKRIVPVALLTGMRQGELFALEDTDLELDDRHLYVRDSKTVAGRRRVVLRREAVTLLREQLLVRANGTRLVFPGSDGHAYDRHSFRTVWHPAIKDANLGHVTFHLLRHSAVSLYAAGGLRLEHVGAQLGWAPSSMAAMYARYRHLFDGELEERIAAMDGSVLDDSRTEEVG